MAKPGIKTTLKTGHEVRYLDQEELEEHKDIVPFMSQGAVIITPPGMLISDKFPKVAEDIYNFRFRQSDIIVEGCPKSGTTWLQEILWTMLHNPNLDSPHASKSLLHRSPFLEMDPTIPEEDFLEMPNFKSDITDFCPGISFENFTFLKMIDEFPSPRILKSHLPPSLINLGLTELAKVVYIIRDPRDACVSYFHHYKVMSHLGYKGTLEKFVDYYIDGKLIHGSMPGLIKEWWPLKDHKNVLFIYYEDLKQKTMGELQRLNQFLALRLSRKQLEDIAKHTSFEEMKERDRNSSAVVSSCVYVADIAAESGGFFNKGVVGTYKETLTPVLKKKLNAYLQENLGDVGLPYNFQE